MPKISVCIPTYNRRDYICETIESILDQTYKDYEIVVVDDGSTDDTKQVLDEKGYPVRYHYQQNCGDAAARNTLIDLADGEYIAFLDSDDLYYPDTLERMIAAAETEKDDVIVYGPYMRIDENGGEISRCKRKLHSGWITDKLFQDILIHSCGSMFPAHILKGRKQFDTSLRVCSDYALWLELSLDYRFIALNEPTFNRRRHSGNLSEISVDNRLTELEVLKRFYYELGGKERINKTDAMRRLSRETYRVAKSARAEGKPDLAKKYFKESFRLKPNMKSFWHCLRG
ncbi:Chondroitin polymerase [Anaerohalosphaera lusitana]|uniref:Chondroitin polymerase n=1 Tax=Anaerohalosphaera lusitana TaxID=1936003 RepID=A0A1U9NMB0_9BACT|nr:glycosyltransferase [Anaerohalosphaera lusitana]AQT68646.1 Chondroitin polymerase [Anaerohalosphaera lusitana]